MNKTLVFSLLLICLPKAAFPQTAKQTDALVLYGFGALGSTSPGSSTTIHLGGGGDWVSKNGLGAGGEFGYLALTQSLGNAQYILSINGAYHFLSSQSSQKTIPFVTGGYSALFVPIGTRTSTYNLGNFGIGLNHWVNERTGIRVEFRDHLRQDGGATSHLYGFRIGIAWREVSPTAKP